MRFATPQHRPMRRAHELNLMCAPQALNLVRKQLFNALREIGLDASMVVVDRSSVDDYASLAATIRCTPEHDGQLQTLTESLRHYEGVTEAVWNAMPRSTPINASHGAAPRSSQAASALTLN